MVDTCSFIPVNLKAGFVGQRPGVGLSFVLRAWHLYSLDNDLGFGLEPEGGISIFRFQVNGNKVLSPTIVFSFDITSEENVGGLAGGTVITRLGSSEEQKSLIGEGTLTFTVNLASAIIETDEVVFHANSTAIPGTLAYSRIFGMRVSLPKPLHV